MTASVEQWLEQHAEELVSCSLAAGARLTRDACRRQQDLARQHPAQRPRCYGCAHSDLPDELPDYTYSATRCQSCGGPLSGMGNTHCGQCRTHTRPWRTNGRRRETPPEPQGGEEMSQRRQYTDEQKLEILARLDAATEFGQKAEIMRELGINSSSLHRWRLWRKQLEPMQSRTTEAPAVERDSAGQERVAALEAELANLRQRLEDATRQRERQEMSAGFSADEVVEQIRQTCLERENHLERRLAAVQDLCQSLAGVFDGLAAWAGDER